MQRRLVAGILCLAIAGCGTANVPLRAPSATTLAVRGDSNAFMQGVFNQADVNHDGFLSREETSLLPEQFAVLDRDGDGKISKDDWGASATFGTILKALPKFLPMVLALHHKLDANHDQRVSLDELHAVMDTSSRDGLAAEQLTSVFKSSDADHSGSLDADEFQSFYTQVGQLPTQGFFKNIAFTLLGTYVSLMSRVAEKQALHASRSVATETPAKFGIPFEQVSFQTSDGITIKAWYIPAAVKTDKSVLMMHGRGDNRGMFIRQGQINWVHPEYNVLAIDLRNHGESGGDVTTFAYDESKDALAAVNYLKSRGNSRIAAYGISLGAATAIRASALTTDINAVVDDCSYATVQSAFTGFISFFMVPGPVLIAAATIERADQDYHIDMPSVEPITQVGKIAPRPFLIIHGTKDQYISPDNSRNNYIAAGDNCPRELWFVPGAQHAASAEAAPDEYKARLLDFLHKSL